MNLDGLTSIQIDFLQRFFGPGNGLRWQEYVNGTMQANRKELLSKFLADFERPGTPVFLPCATSQSTVWYALAHNARQARELKEQLLAFIGPTYSDFNGQLATLDPANPVEAALLEHYAPHIFRLEILRPEDRITVHQQLERLRLIRSQATHRQIAVLRPVGRILRDFEMALVVRNEESALKLLEELRARGRLSASNLAFLQVRVLAEFDRWDELRRLSVYQSLLDGHRPSLVTEALGRCIDEQYFADYEARGDVAGALNEFRTHQAKFSGLFRSRGGSRSPGLLKLWVLHSVALGDETQARRLREILPDDQSAAKWADALIATLDKQSSTLTKPPVDVLAQAREAFEAANYDLAFELLLQCETTAVVLQLIIECAAEIGSLDAAQHAIETVQSASVEIREATLARKVIRQAWERLTDSTEGSQEEAVTHLPVDWNSWLSELDEKGQWPAAVAVAQQGASEWSLSDWKSDPRRIADFANALLRQRPRASADVVRMVTPVLVRSFLGDEGPIREFKPVYLSLLFSIAVDDAIGADDLAVLFKLADAVLQIGLKAGNQANEYQDLIEYLLAAWNQVLAERHLDWALATLDLLFSCNVAQHTSLDPFVHSVLELVRKNARRLREDQWLVIDCLFADLGQSDLLAGLRSKPSDSGQTVAPIRLALRGKSVAIYTLTEQIGRRAQQFLEAIFTEVRVHLLHDKGSSDRLEQLCSSADVFVVNTWDAKHAATGAIKMHRAKDRVTLYPKSKSATALLREVYEFVGGVS